MDSGELSMRQRRHLRMESTEAQARFAARCDKAFVTIVLVIEPSLLNVTGTDPTDPVRSCLEGTGQPLPMQNLGK